MAATQSRRRTRKFSAEQRAAYRDAKREEQRERIEAAARALLTSEGWQRFAAVRARFRRYSLGNCLLIALQCPDATRVTGFRTWQELGRQVRKGERAILINAPTVRKRRVEDDDGEEHEERSLYFRAVPVFDISQTDGDPLPEPPAPEPVTGDSHERFLEPLTAFAYTLGYRVEVDRKDECGGDRQGFCDTRRKRIVLRAGAPANARVRILIHELAHALGVTYEDFARADAEVIVETAGQIVCASIGLDTSGEAVPYIAGWGEDLEAIRKYAETVHAVARQLEEALGLGEAA